jgi:predicted permease
MMQLRYAIRTMTRTPGFVLVAVLTLALGIGFNTAVFSLYQSVALKPLAVSKPAEIVRISGRYDGPEVDRFTFAEYERLRKETRALASVVATSAPENLICVLPDSPSAAGEVVRARLVSANYFSSLGVNPALGRSFGASDAAVAVLSHSFFTRRLHSDAGVLGRSMLVQGTAVTVVGVAAESFAGTGQPAESPDLWIPLSLQPAVMPGVDWLHNDAAAQWQLLARRAPSVSLEQASAELSVLGKSWPAVNGRLIQLRARNATFFQTDSGEFSTFGTVAGVLAIAVGMILLIGCVNLVNLLLARTAARRRELVVRLALGSGRARLIRLLLLESTLLGILGGALGLALAAWMCGWIGVAVTEALERISGGAIRIYLDLTMDWRGFAYTAVLSILTGAIVGILPAVRATRIDLNAALKQEGGHASRLRAGRNLLLAAQVAACLILLAGAGMLFRGVWRSRDVDPGFETQHLMVMGVNAKSLAPAGAPREALVRRVIERVEELPDVVSVAWADRPPFLGHGSGPFENEQKARVSCLFNGISDRYFETLGIPLLAGRNFTALEAAQEAPLVIVSESAARRFWPGRDPIGRQVLTPPWLRKLMKHQSFTVVGVVKSVRSTYLSKVDEGFLYFPKSLPVNIGLILVRTRIAPRAVFAATHTALGGVHPNLPSQTYMVTLEEGPIAIQRMMAEAPALVASVLGLLALVLAAVGIFGVASYLVAQRTREIGIHMALGAQHRDVIVMVLGQSLRPVAWGAAIGLAGAFGAAALLRATVVMPDLPDLTYGAGAFHPATYLSVCAILAAVVVIAVFVPVRRATRVQPIEALRNE